MELLITICICACMCTWVWVCWVYTCMNMGRSKQDAGCLLLLGLYLMALIKYLLLSCKPVIEVRVTSYLPDILQGVIDMCHHSYLLTWLPEILTQVLTPTEWMPFPNEPPTSPWLTNLLTIFSFHWLVPDQMPLLSEVPCYISRTFLKHGIISSGFLCLLKFLVRRGNAI